MKPSPAQYPKKQSGESNLLLKSVQSCKGDTAKKREREKDAGLVLENREDSQKRSSQGKSENKAKIYSLTSEVSTLKQQQLKLKVDQLLCKNDNRPLKALWEALNDKATPCNENELMAIVMDPRCGIERRAERDDDLVDSDGKSLVNSTPLMMAVQVHRNDVVEALLAAGADHSTFNNSSYTSFLVAASYSNVTAMDLLVRYGADPLAVSKSVSLTALHIAALKGRAQAIQVLVELGASTEAVDVYGYTPLLRSSRGDAPSIVDLIDNGANLEAVDPYGKTALHFATLRGHIGAIEALVWEGASITAKDKSGLTPLELFHSYSRKRCTDAEKARVTALLTTTA